MRTWRVFHLETGPGLLPCQLPSTPLSFVADTALGGRLKQKPIPGCRGVCVCACLNSVPVPLLGQPCPEGVQATCVSWRGLWAGGLCMPGQAGRTWASGSPRIDPAFPRPGRQRGGHTPQGCCTWPPPAPDVLSRVQLSLGPAEPFPWLRWTSWEPPALSWVAAQRAAKGQLVLRHSGLLRLPGPL